MSSGFFPPLRAVAAKVARDSRRCFVMWACCECETNSAASSMFRTPRQKRVGKLLTRLMPLKSAESLSVATPETWRRPTLPARFHKPRAAERMQHPSDNPKLIPTPNQSQKSSERRNCMAPSSYDAENEGLSPPSGNDRARSAERTISHCRNGSARASTMEDRSMLWSQSRLIKSSPSTIAATVARGA